VGGRVAQYWPCSAGHAFNSISRGCSCTTGTPSSYPDFDSQIENFTLICGLLSIFQSNHRRPPGHMPRPTPASSTSQALSFVQYLLYVSSVQHLHLISEAGTSPPRQTVQPTCGWLPSLISVRRIETPRGRRCGNRARGLLNTGRLGGVFREGCGESEGSSIPVGWAESFVKEAGSRRNAWYRPVGWKSTLGYQWEGCSISLDGCISC